MIGIADAKTRLEIIHKFYEQISWADECRIYDVELAELIPLMIHDTTWFWPCFFYSVEQIKHESELLLLLVKETMKNDSSIIDPSHCLIIDGEINDKSMEELIYTLQSLKITPFFTNARSSINYSHWLCKALDGIDWGRSFESFCEKGKDAKPIMQWD